MLILYKLIEHLSYHTPLKKGEKNNNLSSLNKLAISLVTAVLSTHPYTRAFQPWSLQGSGRDLWQCLEYEYLDAFLVVITVCVGAPSR